MLTFMVRASFYQDAIKIANKLADLSQAFEIESTMCKSLATVSVLYLVLGDVVKVSELRNSFVGERSLIFLNHRHNKYICKTI
jgi:hypothetical protein